MAIIEGNDPVLEPSFTLRNRALRQLWSLVWLVLFRPSPRPMHFWRSCLLRIFGARLGRNVHVYPGVMIWAPWQLVIGDNVGIASGVTLYNMDYIRIGNNCVISQGAHLCAGSHDYNSRNFQLIAKPIELEPHVWVCAGAFISPGVKIAKGSVIAPHSVVTRSLHQGWMLYAGQPAKAIKERKRHE